MDKLTDLKDLLRHEIEDLHSAEEQITDALPAMIIKADNLQLKKALEDHLYVTQTHRARIKKVMELLQEPKKGNKISKPKKFLSELFGGVTTHKCIGTEGLIKEGKQVMKEKMNPEVMDAAIIACAQKIEHYEISGYGTALAYAKELKLDQVEKFLAATLAEEYEADDVLTKLAVGGGVNQKAEQAPGMKRVATGNALPSKNAKSPKKTSGKTTKRGAAKTEPTNKKSPSKKAPEKS